MGRAVVCRLASLGHDVVAMVRDVQAASRRLPSGIALRVADYAMVLISSDGDASAVMRHHANAIEAATATNIRHITFTSIVDTDELSPFYFSPAYRDAERRLVVRTKQITPVASSSATPASEHVLDQRGASFETAAPRLPQDEGFS